MEILKLKWNLNGDDCRKYLSAQNQYVWTEKKHSLPGFYVDIEFSYVLDTMFINIHWHWPHRDMRMWGEKLIHWQSFSISPLVHLKNERGDWISANDSTHPGGHSYPVHVLTLSWLFKRNRHVEGSLWNGPYYYLWSRERPCELF